MKIIRLQPSTNSASATHPVPKALTLAVASALGLAAPSLYAATCTATNDATLRACIAGAASGDVIDITSNITLSSYLPAIGTDLTVTGNGNTISGNSLYRVFWVDSGTVSFQNLAIANSKARGGNGGVGNGGGGGGAGLGGGLFVNGGAVTLDTVTFSNNTATGGSGGTAGLAGGGGGAGGMGGNGGAGSGAIAGGGGGLNPGQNGSGATAGGSGGAGGAQGAPGTAGGLGGGGGGSGHHPRSSGGGAGGFGGGGGGSGYDGGPGGVGGFGGGGGGGGYASSGGVGGWGAGTGGNSRASGGGGAGLGGAVFAKAGTLTFKNVTFTSSTATGGGGQASGQGRGGAIFICTATENAGCSATIDEGSSCGATFSGGTAAQGQPDLFWTGAGGGAHNITGITDSCGPSATTGVANSLSATGATLNGTVNDNGIAVSSIYFDYGASSPAYGSQATATPSSLSIGAGSTAVSAAISGLSGCNTLYHFRANATHAGGTVNGSDATFATSACTTGPTVSTSAATSVTTTGATLNGSVTDVGLNVADIQFEYGTATGTYGAPVNATPATITATPGTAQTVTPTKTLTGLTCNTNYFYRIKATDGTQTNNGSELNFTTSPCTTGPTVTTNAATSVTGTGATLNGSVTDVGLNVSSIGFEYGLTTGYGSTGTASVTSLTATPGTPQTVNPTASITGLTCGGTTYHYRIAATDATQTNNGADQTFVTGACNAAPVATVNAITGTTAVGDTLTGSYSYSDGENQAEDTSGSAYRWVRSTDNSVTTAGDNTDVDDGPTGGAPGNDTYVITATDRDQYLFYCVTPKASAGTLTGTEACSTGIQIPNNAITLTVTTNADPGTVGGCISAPATDCSLRDAIATASGTVADTINFAAGLTGQTITLTGNALALAKDLTIDGIGRQITVSGNNAVRVFSITSGTVALKNLTVASGSANGFLEKGGGLIIVNSTVTVTNAALLNHSAFECGAISNNGVTVLNNVTFAGNQANSSASALCNNSGSVTLNNVTVAGNNNPVALQVSGGAVTLNNTLLANNAGGNCSGTIINGGNNLDDGADCGFGSANGSLSSTDPLLGTLDNYGGDTQTFPLLPGSPAIDAGKTATCADATTVNNLDQRGVPRPQGTVCDIGAFESQGFTFAKSGDNQSATVSTAFASPLGVTVTPVRTGDPVNGGQVTFTAPGSGASAVLVGSPVTIAGGAAQVTATANATAGSYQVATSAAGASDASFSLTNTTSGGGGGGGGVTPVNGACGSANGQTFTTAPTSGFCTLGDASAVSGAGPWSWSCAGSFGGSAAPCSAAVPTYPVTVTAGEGGAISPVTQTVNHGATAAFTVTANTGYGIDTVTGCGGTLAGTTYTTGAITAACTVNATFKATAHATTTTLTSAPNPSTSGQSVTLTAIVSATNSAPTGAVTFRNSDATISGCAGVTLSGNTATCVTATLPVGVQTLSGVYAGNATFTASTGTTTHTVNALEPVTLTPLGLPNAVVGIPYAATLSASGGEPPYTYTATGLPAGLSLTPVGILSGTPLQAGASTVTITVTDAQGQTDQRAYPLTVANDLAVVTPHLIDGIVGAAYGQTLAAIGGNLPYTWSLRTGALPVGLTLDSASGLLSGTPLAPATATFTVQVTDAHGQAATHDLSLTIQAVTFTRPDPVNPTQPPVTVALKANSAAGATCAFDDQNSFTFPLGQHGVPVTPPPGVAFPHGLLQIVVDGCTPGETTLTLTVVYPQTLPDGTQFWKYGPTPTNPAADWYLLPGAVVQGNTVTYTVRDGGLGDDDLTANGSITDPGGPAMLDFTLTGEVPTTGTVGDLYEGALTTHNGVGPYVWSVAAGALPAGLLLVEGVPHAPTAFLSGTPTQAGDFTFTLQVIDEGQGHATAQQAYTVTITGLEPPAPCPWGLGPDTDGDGVPDATETAQGTNPQVKDNDVFTRTDAFVAQTYRDLFQREADSAGLAYWQAQLQAGVTRGGIIDAFYQAGEFQNGIGAITRLYHAAFNRTPDACGLAYWVDQWQAGDTLDHIADFFVVSGEFLDQGLTDPKDFVTRLYENVLGRAPDAEGLAFWLHELDQGATWGQVLLGFTQSAEYRAALDSRVTADLYYQGFLNRDPDVSGYAFWVHDLDQTADPRPVHEAVQALPEYRYRVLGTVGVTRQ